MEKIGNIWFSSDTHAFHKNICKGSTTWTTFEAGSSHQSLRDFENQEEMTEELVNRFNSVVKENDTLYHLGDWSFGGHENIKRFRDMLNCKNIHLIFGNHDQHITPINSPYRQLFSSCDYYKELNLKLDKKWQQFKKIKIVMNHYAMRVWNQSHHGSLHLFGHSHGSLSDVNNRSMDVGADTNNLYPYHLDEILDRLIYRSIDIVDHHNKLTN